MLWRSSVLVSKSPFMAWGSYACITVSCNRCELLEQRCWLSDVILATPWYATDPPWTPVQVSLQCAASAHASSYRTQNERGQCLKQGCTVKLATFFRMKLTYFSLTYMDTFTPIIFLKYNLEVYFNLAIGSASTLPRDFFIYSIVFLENRWF